MCRWIEIIKATNTIRRILKFTHTTRRWNVKIRYIHTENIRVSCAIDCFKRAHLHWQTQKFGGEHETTSKWMLRQYSSNQQQHRHECRPTFIVRNCHHWVASESISWIGKKSAAVKNTTTINNNKTNINHNRSRWQEKQSQQRQQR